MHEVLVNRLGGLSLPRNSVVRLTGRPDMTLDVDRGRKTATQKHCRVYMLNRNILASAGRSSFHVKEVQVGKWTLLKYVVEYADTLFRFRDGLQAFLRHSIVF